MADAVRRFIPRTPFHMVWLATNACNARCRHCSSNSSLRSPDELTTQEALHLIDDLADAGVVDLAVSGGEPLLRRDLFEIIGRARLHGMTVGVGSNGGMLSERHLAALVASGINRFQVSLDGFADAHDALRRWPGLFERVLHTIHIASAAQLRVHVCCTVNRLNIAQLGLFAEFVSTLGVARLNLSRYVPTGRGRVTLDCEPAEWRAVVEMTAELRRRFAGRMDVVSHHAQEALVDPDILSQPSFLGCQAGIGQGCVTANGTVYPCVLLPVAIGNIREMSFLDLWTKSAKIADLQRRAVKDACGSCSLKWGCGGCRAVAYASTGDFLASDPRCWTQFTALQVEKGNNGNATGTSRS